MEILIAGITVTEEDIRKGERCSTRRCPIALAASRTLGEPDTMVTDEQIWAGTANAWHAYSLPLIASTFIGVFDRQRLERTEFKPFSFPALRCELLSTYIATEHA